MNGFQGGSRQNIDQNTIVRPKFGRMGTGSGMMNCTDELTYPWDEEEQEEELNCGD